MNDKYFIKYIDKNGTENIMFDADQMWLDNILLKINEGINIIDNVVEITDEHEDGVDTSVNTNPTYRTFKVNDELSINLYSIFTRNDKLITDGNPLLYALKNEKQFHFKSKKALGLFWKRFDEILDKFIHQYGVNDTAILYSDNLFNTGIVLPSSNTLNSVIVQHLKTKFKNITIIDDLLQKVTYEDVYLTCKNSNSYFYNYWMKFGTSVYLQKIKQLEGIIKRNGGINALFSFHKINDINLRKTIADTMKLNAKYIDAYIPYINDKNILFIDDSITFGQSLKDAINIIIDTYKPKSVSGLTMLSPKNYS